MSENSSLNRPLRRRWLNLQDESSIELSGGQFTESRQPILLLVQLLSKYDIPILPFNPSTKWNARSQLGKGAIFTVEESKNTLSRFSIANPNYRNPQLQRPKSEVAFTDHNRRKWSVDTDVAFKTTSNWDKSIQDIAQELIYELCVWLHAPIQRHPNVASLIGVIWLPAEYLGFAQQNEENRHGDECPVIVLEKADQGDLDQLLSAKRSTGTPISLIRKIQVCIDVLAAIKTLHGNNILHGDIKCANVLVFKNTDGSYENWTGKLCDFSHSKCDVLSPLGFKSSELVGTPLYSPPEISSVEFIRREDILAIDIWCWGLLLWNVLTDGFFFLGSEGETFDETALTTIKRDPNITDKAIAASRAYMNVAHQDDEALWKTVALDAMGRSLCVKPEQRWSAAKLLEHTVNAFCKLGGRYDVRSEANITPTEPISLNALPFFELTRLYYDLMPLSTLSRTIVKELHEITENIDMTLKREAQFQLGLCHAVGFGTETNVPIAIELIGKAALGDGGLPKARTCLPTILNAWGLHDSSIPKDVLTQWLVDAAENGSIIAARTLKWHCSSVYNETRHGSDIASVPEVVGTPNQLQHEGNVSKRSRRALNRRLIGAAQCQDIELACNLLDAGASADYRGEIGETALHYAALSQSGEITTSLTKALLKSNADISIHCFGRFSPADDPSPFDSMAANKTPLEWAIAADNVAFLKCLFDHRQLKISFKNIAYACRHHSVDVLRFMSLLPEFSRSISKADSFGRTAMYYAIRPDAFRRILAFRYRETSPKFSEQPPFIRQQLEVLKILVDAGSSWDVCQDKLFNCLHMLAAQGDHTLLRALMKNWPIDNLANEVSKFGWTPLKDAIAQGNKATVDALLEHRASVNNVWPEIKAHALHICPLSNNPVVITIADRILREHPKAIKLEDKEGFTFLHKATEQGRLELMSLALKHGASLRDKTGNPNGRFTPLGVAILNRSVRTVRFLLALYKKHRASGIRSWRIFQFSEAMDSNAFQFLLSPGRHSPGHAINLTFQQMNRKTGCCDYPFSRASQQILSCLLDYDPSAQGSQNLADATDYPIVGDEENQLSTTNGTIFDPRRGRPKMLDRRWGVSNGIIVRSPFTADWRDCGISGALKIWNYDAIQIIIESRQFDLDFELLCFLACRDRTKSPLFIAPDSGNISPSVLFKAKQRLITYLLKHEKNQYRGIRQRRTSGRLACLWTIYYTLHGDARQRLILNAIDWARKDPVKVKPIWHEFKLWPYTHYTLMMYNVIILGCLLALALSRLLAVASSPATYNWNREKTTKYAVAFILSAMTSIWQALFQGFAIQFDLLLERYYRPRPVNWRSYWRIALQAILLTSFIALSVYAAYLWVTVYYRERDVSFDMPDQLSVSDQETFDRFVTISHLLMVWHIFSTTVMAAVVGYLYLWEVDGSGSMRLIEACKELDTNGDSIEMQQFNRLDTADTTFESGPILTSLRC